MTVLNMNLDSRQKNLHYWIKSFKIDSFSIVYSIKGDGPAIAEKFRQKTESVLLTFNCKELDAERSSEARPRQQLAGSLGWLANHLGNH